MSSLQTNIAQRESLLIRLGRSMQPYLFRLVQLLVNGGNFAIYAYVLWVSIPHCAPAAASSRACIPP